MAELRLVQVAWAIGVLGCGPPTVKGFLVQPSGFQIETSATETHRITHDHATKHGSPVKTVLGNLLADLRSTLARGGRLTSFNLAFDAAVIHNELGRAELESTWVLGMRRPTVDWTRCTRTSVCG